MKPLRTGRSRQRGVALMLIACVLILGVAGFAITALNRSAAAPADRDALTAQALHAAKQALLAYAAAYAARTDHEFPGRMPCPESLSALGTGAEGFAANAAPPPAAPDHPGSCLNAAPAIGRLPWKTLGIDQLRDGDGEPLWYVVSANFRPEALPPANPALNFDTAAALPFDGANVVALIVAAGKAVNTLSDPGTPPAPCAKLRQTEGRYLTPLDPAKFFECGNAAGAYQNLGKSHWTNDRAMAITQAEWASAIAGAVNDRIQRQVAPAIRTWDASEFALTGKSWGVTHGLAYLPFAADWGDPTTASYCGSQSTVRGLMPLDPSCHNNPWTVVDVSTGGLLSIYGGGNGCTNMGAFLRCRFQRILGLGAASATIQLTASDVARAFRSTLRSSDLTMTNSGTKTISMSLSNSTSDATMTVNLTWPGNLLLLGLLEVASVDIPHLQNAQIYTDARLAWFWSNQWQRYTLYAISPGAAASPSFANRCNSAGDPGCLTVNALPASTGSVNDKRLVLVLSGKPVGTQTQPSASLANYFEAQNASADLIYETASVNADFNDRIAACPFKHQNHVGADILICN